MREYKTYEAWQRRVIDERQELNARLFRLEAMLARPNSGIPVDQLTLLSNQRNIMEAYSHVLTQRIDSWG